MAQTYLSDLNDNQWTLLEGLLPDAKPGGRPRTVNLRHIINGILYILCTGCPWRYLPKDYPNSKTVYHYFAQWRDDRTWHQVHERLRQWTRTVEYDRFPLPRWQWLTVSQCRVLPWFISKWATTEPRSSKGENAIYSLIAWVSSSVDMSLPRISLKEQA